MNQKAKQEMQHSPVAELQRLASLQRLEGILLHARRLCPLVFLWPGLALLVLGSQPHWAEERVVPGGSAGISGGHHRQ